MPDVVYKIAQLEPLYFVRPVTSITGTDLFDAKSLRVIEVVIIKSNNEHNSLLADYYHPATTLTYMAFRTPPHPPSKAS